MFIRIIVFCLAVLSFGGTSWAELPEKIKRIAEETTLEFCSIVELKGKFVSAVDESDMKQIIWCGNSFLVSQNEVLTNNHVIGDPIRMITSRFDHLMDIYDRSGNLNGHAPKRIDRVDFYMRLSTKDGVEYVSDRITYAAKWDGAFSRSVVAAFLKSISQARKERETVLPSFELLGKDEAHDLALLELSKPLVRLMYFTITPFHPSQGTPAWGYALLPSLLGDSTSALVNEGRYVGVNAYDGTLTIETFSANRPGVSGSATVDAFARLVGVTTKISTLEKDWYRNEPFPCSAENPCTRYLVDVGKVITFLEKVRKKK